MMHIHYNHHYFNIIWKTSCEFQRDDKVFYNECFENNMEKDMPVFFTTHVDKRILVSYYFPLKK